MFENFRKYLVVHGFKEYSANSNPSSALDYVWRLNRICLIEGMTEQQLADNINAVLERYGRSGEQWCIGKRSHESYLNALRQFKKFISIQRSSALSIFKLGSSKY